MHCCLLPVFAFPSGARALATELVYSPVNPSFGGNPLNGQWLLGYAGAQNTFKEHRDVKQPKTFGEKLLEDFSRKFVGRVENEILDALFDNAAATQSSSNMDIYPGEINFYISVEQYGNNNSSLLDMSY